MLLRLAQWLATRQAHLMKLGKQTTPLQVTSPVQSMHNCWLCLFFLARVKENRETICLCEEVNEYLNMTLYFTVNCTKNVRREIRKFQ